MECCICLNALEEGEVVMLECSHAVHRECIYAWWARDQSCPTCRARVPVLPARFKNEVLIGPKTWYSIIMQCVAGQVRVSHVEADFDLQVGDAIESCGGEAAHKPARVDEYVRGCHAQNRMAVLSVAARREVVARSAGVRFWCWRGRVRVRAAPPESGLEAGDVLLARNGVLVYDWPSLIAARNPAATEVFLLRGATSTTRGQTCSYPVAQVQRI